MINQKDLMIIKNLINHHTNYQSSSISSIIKINKGLTNKIFKISFNDDTTLKVRIASQNPFINRQLEVYIEQQLIPQQLIYFDHANGNSIKYWINGKNLTKKDLNNHFWISINEILNQLHQLQLVQPIKINDVLYYDDLNQFQDLIIYDALKMYQKLVNQFDQQSFVISHNDCSTNNIVVNNNQYYLIDYEWASYNHELWDICNLIKDLDLSIKELKSLPFINKNNFQTYLEIIFCTYCYTFIWTTRVKLTKKIKDYQDFIITKILVWYDNLKYHYEN